MDLNKLCMGCMEEKGDTKVCPKCGWFEGTQADSPLHLKSGTILLGKYLIGRVLGHGGFGITYLACDINLGSKLAIKEYFPQGMATRNMGDATISVYSGGTKEQFEYGLDKFLEEARTLAKFDDISEIVTAKDFFKENGTAYLVMSYVEGITLKQYLKQNSGKLPLDAVLNIMLPIMKALEHVHKAGILHRDISPDNIYITNNFNVKLLDFGAARFAIGEHSKSLSVILKPGYAPEEQYRSRGRQGPWTDVYAVGATMYTALTGYTPPEALDRMDEDSIKKPSELGVEINKKFEDALMKSLVVRAVGRFQSINEFEIELFKEISNVTSKNYTQKENFTQKERENELKDKQNSDDKNIKKSLQHKFDLVGVFSEGLAYVKKDDKFGFINEDGNVVIQLQFDHVNNFSSGKAYVWNQKRGYYIDKNGVEIRKNRNTYKALALIGSIIWAIVIVFRFANQRQWISFDLLNFYRFLKISDSDSILNLVMLISSVTFSLFFYSIFKEQINLKLKSFIKIIFIGSSLGVLARCVDLFINVALKSSLHVNYDHYNLYKLKIISDIFTIIFAVSLSLWFLKEITTFRKFYTLTASILSLGYIFITIKYFIVDFGLNNPKLINYSLINFLLSFNYRLDFLVGFSLSFNLIIYFSNLYYTNSANK